MQLSFRTEDLRKLCSDAREQQKRLGKQGARALQARLADLLAANTVHELVAGKPHELTGDRRGQFSVSLDGGRRLVFEPTADPVPRRAGDGIAWERVTAVRIVFIGDYHD